VGAGRTEIAFETAMSFPATRYTRKL